MHICIYLHSRAKRAEAQALMDCGATKNFMNLEYAKYLKLPITQLPEEQPLYNVDGTLNKTGCLQYSTNLKVQTGDKKTVMQFFLSDLGKSKVILGYPWFAAHQPQIDWHYGWIDPEQLPLVLCAVDANRITFIPCTKNIPQNRVSHTQYFIGRLVAPQRVTTCHPSPCHPSPCDCHLPS
jgi:hypothetical protein